MSETAKVLDAAADLTKAERPAPKCHACSIELDPTLEATGVLMQKVGYRRTDCEKLFCASCIKGDKHVKAWRAPCADEAERLKRAEELIADVSAGIGYNGVSDGIVIDARHALRKLREMLGVSGG